MTTIVSHVETPTDVFYSAPSLPLTTVLNSISNIPNNIIIECETLAHVVSHEIDYDLLFKLAQRIQSLSNDPNIQGIVVSQGTNSLEEVSYFIHLVVHTAKPIIFTGAMRPTNALGYDGHRNLYNAIMLAASIDAAGKGVLVTFNESIVSARDAAKLNASWDFSGNPFGLLGYMHAGATHFYRIPAKKHTIHSEFNLEEIKFFPTILIFYGHLGIDATLIKTALTLADVRGIISAGMGNGHQPKAMTEALAQASQKGIFVVRCARSGQGIVWRDPHTDDKYDFIAGDSLTPQKARILLAVALSKANDPKVLQRIFTEY